MSLTKSILIILSAMTCCFPLSTFAATKEEMVAFVKEAVDYAKKNPREQVLKEFTDPKGKWVRGELYLFSYDMHGKCVAHGGRALLVGSDMINMEDRTGKHVVQEFIKVTSTKGSGFVDFEWDNPRTHTYDQKLGFAEKIDDNWWVGSGIYLGIADPKTFKKLQTH